MKTETYKLYSLEISELYSSQMSLKSIHVILS